MSDSPFDGLPFNPSTMIEFAQSNYAASAESRDRNFSPTTSQFALKEGDVGFVGGTDSHVDHDLVMVRVIFPDETAQNEYPDWEERLSNSYVFCQWRSYRDPEGDYGWFARAGIIPLSKETYDKVTADFDAKKKLHGEHFNMIYPELNKAYREHNAEVAKLRDIAKVGADSLRCTGCDSVQMHVKVITREEGYYNAAWMVDKQGEKKLFKASELSLRKHMDAWSVCEDCGKVTELPNDILAVRE